MAFTLQTEGDVTTGNFYCSGQPATSSSDLSGLTPWLEKHAPRLSIGPTVLYDNQRLFTEFDVYSVTLYGRALSPDEIRARCNAGMPKETP